MKKLFVSLIIIIIAGYLSADWQHLGLSGYTVNELRFFDNYLYAATDNGIFRKDVNEADTLWTHLGLEDHLVLSLAIINNDEILAGCSDSDDSIAEYPIMRTDDGGQTWYSFSEGLSASSPFGTTSIDLHPDNPGTYFSTPVWTVARLIEPQDLWELVWNSEHLTFWLSFVRINPENPDHIWAGGESGLFAPFLVHSTDGGDTWTFKDLWDVIAGDNRCSIIAFDPVDSQVLYVGMLGGIIKSTDGGENWSLVLESGSGTEYPYFIVNGIAVSQHDNQVVYASSYEGDEDQNLLLYITLDSGHSWNVVDGGFGSRKTLSLEYCAIENEDEIYLGTGGDGVFRFTYDLEGLSVEDNSEGLPGQNRISNYPNPFNNGTTIRFTLNNPSEVKLSVYSVKGTHIATLKEERLNAGEYSLKWEGTDAQGNHLPSGIYFSVLETEDITITGKMIHLK